MHSFADTTAFLRLENALMNAWPGLESMPDGPWVARFGEGYTRRANSISIFQPADDAPARLARCSALFIERGMAPCVRLADFMEADLSPVLDAAGFGAPFDEVVTLWKVLSSGTADPEVEIVEGAPSEAWLEAKDRLSEDTPAASAARRKLLAVIAIPTAFAAWRDNSGRISALGYAAVDRDIASLNMVAVDPVQRGRRLAMKVCDSLLAWAHARGAREACLQMAGTNTSGYRLYGRMGFSGPIYRYSYRTQSCHKASL